MAKALYRGFSTIGHSADPAKGFLAVNQELVKRDLMNHINTVRGERPMLPDFGTSIPLLAFEPLDKQTLAIVEADLREVIAYDPRVELRQIVVSALPENNAIVAFVDLNYVELQTTETLRLEFPVGA